MQLDTRCTLGVLVTASPLRCNALCATCVQAALRKRVGANTSTGRTVPPSVAKWPAASSMIGAKLKPCPENPASNVMSGHCGAGP